jgi:hypothetical protein
VQRLREHTYNQDAAGTSRSRIKHFIAWCNRYHIKDDLLSNIPTFREANAIFSCYALDLAMGHTLLCKTIKSGTIKHYVKDAADRIMEARRRTISGLPNASLQWLDPRLDITTGKTAKDISIIYDEVHRWETIPDRREPLTIDMITYSALQCNPSTPYDIHNVMYDWTVVGIYTGIRLTEWAQDDSGIVMTPADEPKAFLWKDVEFRGTNNRRMSVDAALAKPNNIHTARLTWRWQKNGENGQQKTIVRAFSNPTLCSVSALIRIMKRFEDLGCDKDTMPLAVFTSNGLADGDVTLVRDNHIVHHLQTAAKAVYNIKDPDELKRFSSHSIRVGACVALHAAGVSKMDIKHALRWKSNCFMMYLRDLPCQAQRMTVAVLNFSPDRLDIIPHAATA